MNPVLARILFYGGNLVGVWVMCQSWFERAFLDLFGDGPGESLFSFVRTNVEAPISAVALALYLDLVLRRRNRTDMEAEAPA